MPEPTNAFEQRAELVRCAASFVYFLARYVFIEDQVRGAIPFAEGGKLWSCHLRAAEALEQRKLIVVLKARQIGMSWLFGAAYPLWLAHFHPNKRAMLFSMREDEAAELIRKCRFVWARLPDWMRVTLAKDNALELVFEGMDSYITGYPSSPSAGSSYAASYALADEHAKQTYAAEQYAAIKPTIDMGGQFVSLSTANGPGTFHHRLWVGAIKGTNGFFPLFFPYNEHPARDDDWWQAMRPTYEHEWQFHQEYPRDPDEAIQSSVPRFFNHDNLVLRASVTTPLTKAHLASETDPELLELLRVRGGRDDLGFRLYQTYNPLHSYVAGADVSEGTVSGDAQAAYVLDRETGEEVAVLHGHWGIPDYALHLDRLAAYFHALLGVERNNHGHALITTLQRLMKQRKPCPYSLYFEKPVLDRQGKVAAPGKPGWLTSPRTKPLMFTDLQAGLRAEDFKVASQAVLEEAKNVTEDEDGKLGALPGFHDDLIVAAAIAYQMAIRTPTPRERPQIPYAMGQNTQALLANAGIGEAESDPIERFLRHKREREQLVGRPRPHGHDGSLLRRMAHRTLSSGRVPAW